MNIFARIAWGAGTLAYLINLFARIGNGGFYLIPDDAVALLLIAGVASIVWKTAEEK